MKKILLILAAALFVGCSAEPTTDVASVLDNGEQMSSSQPVEAVTSTPADAQLISDIWDNRIYYIYWELLNGKYHSIEITNEDIGLDEAADMIIYELVQGGYEEFNSKVEDYLADGMFVIPFDLLDDVSLRLFNKTYDWSNPGTLHLNGQLPTVVDDSWHINIHYDFYSRKSDIPYNQPVEDNPHAFPYARIENAERFSDGRLVFYLSEKMYSDYTKEEFITTQHDEITFMQAENGEYYLYNINRSYDETNIFSYPENAEPITDYLDYTGSYITTIGDKNLSYDFTDEVVNYYLSDVITGEVLAKQSLPSIAGAVYNVRTNVYKESIVAAVAGHYYMLDKELAAEPKMLLIDDSHNLLFSPDGTRYIRQHENNDLELVELDSGDSVLLEVTESINNEVTSGKLGLAKGFNITELAVDYEERYVPIKFYDNNTVVLTLAGYEHTSGHALYDIESGVLTPFFTDLVIGYEFGYGITDYGYVGAGYNGLYVYSFDEGTLVESSTSLSIKTPYGGFAIGQERYVPLLTFAEDTVINIVVVDSSTGELIDKGVSFDSVLYSQESIFPLPDGKVVVTLSIYGESLRYIV